MKTSYLVFFFSFSLFPFSAPIPPEVLFLTSPFFPSEGFAFGILRFGSVPLSTFGIWVPPPHNAPCWNGPFRLGSHRAKALAVLARTLSPSDVRGLAVIGIPPNSPFGCVSRFRVCSTVPASPMVFIGFFSGPFPLYQSSRCLFCPLCLSERET